MSHQESCTCPAAPAGAWECCDCPEHGEEASAWMDAEAASEMAAESAWLRAAEYDPEAEAFAAYEASMGLF